jgi:hypothetical protein
MGPIGLLVGWQVVTYGFLPKKIESINPLTPNDPYMGRTATLTS